MIEYAVTNPESTVTYTVENRVMFFSSDIVGVNRAVSGQLKWREGALAATIEGSLVIQANAFDSDNETRDEHVAEILHAADHPVIVFTLSSATSADGEFLQKVEDIAAIQGIMEINGMQQFIEIPVAIERRSNALTVKGGIQVRFEDFGLESPSTLGFVANAAEEIDLYADVVCTLQAAR